PRERRGRAESRAVIDFFGLAAAAFEASPGGRNRQEEFPIALRRVQRRAPEQRSGEVAQTHALLRAILPAAVGRVGHDIVVALREFLFAQEARRFPVGSVELDAAIDTPGGREVVHDAKVSLLDVRAAVRPPAIFVIPARAEHTTAGGTVVEA